MIRTNAITAALAASALSLTLATPALAGKANDARKAIAAAEAKIETAHTMGAGHALPEESAAADEALSLARTAFKNGHKEEAIEDATHAEALATTAIGRIQQSKDAALASAQEERDAVAADAQGQVANAQAQAADAQAQAAEANARAQVAAQSAAEARNAALAAAATPTQVETTVTTQKASSAPRKVTTRKVVRRKAPSSVASSADKVTTTTTVSQGPNY